LICWQQQKLRRACRRLGAQVLAALETGEVNPLLTEEVKDSLEAARSLTEGKNRHYQAIAALREKMRSSCAGESPTQPDDPGGSSQSGNKTE